VSSFNFGTGGSSGGSGGFNFGTSSSSPTKKKSGGGLLGAILHDASVASGVDLAKHLGGDVANAATMLLPGLYNLGRAAVAPGHNPSWSELGQQYADFAHHPLREIEKAAKTDRLGQIETAMAKYYEDYYGHNVLSHIYQHPLQPLLDLSLAYTGGAGIAAKAGRASAAAGKTGRLATLGEIADQESTISRSPRAVFKESGGPVARASTNPRAGVRFRQVAGERLRQTRTTEGGSKIAAVAPAGLGPFGSEMLKWARSVYNEADRTRLMRLDPLRAYNKLIGKLTQDEITALQMRSHGVTAADLKEAWAGTPDGKLITPKVDELIDKPDEKMIRAEPAHRAMAQYVEDLYTEHGLLRPETAAARKDFSAGQISNMLGRPAERLFDPSGTMVEPYYMPHLIHDSIGTAPGARMGGGKGMPRRLGTMKRNEGTLISQGNVHYMTDVLGPEMARRVKYLMHRELFKAHMRGGVPLTKEMIDGLGFGGKLPKGWSFVRKVTLQRESDRIQTEIDKLQRLQDKGRPSAIRGAAILKLQHDKEAALAGENRVVGEKRQTIPATMRAEAPTGADLFDLVNNPEDLRGSSLQPEEGFRTTEPEQAVKVGDHYIAIPNRVSKAMTGEYTRSNSFMYWLQQHPIKVWRALILGTRPAFLVNNMVGNSLMYLAKTGGNGALMSFVRAMREMHGDAVVRKMLDDPATPPELRTQIMQGLHPDQSVFRRHFPEQQQGGSFGYTQSPIGQSLWKDTGTRATRLARTLTTAIPHVTANLAEVRMRNAMAQNLIENSQEFKTMWDSMAPETRTFSDAVDNLMQGKGGAQYQRYISDQIDRSLGQYRHMAPIESGTLRSLMPFYAWYKAIVSATFHLAIDNPVRAYALFTLGQIGEQTSKQLMGQTLLPKFLQGAIPAPFGFKGPGGTQRYLATSSLNPWYTIAQLLRSGGDVSQMGLNPFLQGAFNEYAKEKNASGGTGTPSVPGIVGHGLEAIVTGLPTGQLFAPKGPSKLYPIRGAANQIARREAAFWAWLGLPLKEVNPTEATAQATGTKTPSSKKTTSVGGFNFGTSG